MFRALEAHTPVIDLFEVGARVQQICDDIGLPCCFIGGVAVQRWGEPRVTRNVDLAVFAGFGREAEIATRLFQDLQPRRPDGVEFARQYRVVLASLDGVGIDISLAALPFEERMIDRATDFVFAPGITLRTCTAEDLVILKGFAARPQDWLDIDRIADCNPALDWEAIMPTLTELAALKDDATILPRIREIRKRSAR